MERVEAWIRRMNIAYRVDLSGKRLTTFGSGGTVHLVAFPREFEEVRNLLSLLTEENIPFRVLGGGSNVLIPDSGFAGAIVKTDQMRRIAIKGDLVTAEAGVRLPLLAEKCKQASLSGAEFTSGIPGEMGGAVYMNASAFGTGVSDLLTEVRLLVDEKIITVPASALHMEYHRGGLPVGAMLLSATLRLKKGDSDHIAAEMHRLAEKRAAAQPKERSAGSVFSRVGEIPAALYIEKTGLKGTRVGAAELSAIHCNFIVNRGGATTEDYFLLAERVRREVQKSAGVTLAYEVECINAERPNGER